MLESGRVCGGGGVRLGVCAVAAGEEGGEGFPYGAGFGKERLGVRKGRGSVAEGVGRGRVKRVSRKRGGGGSTGVSVRVFGYPVGAVTFSTGSWVVGLGWLSGWLDCAVGGRVVSLGRDSNGLGGGSYSWDSNLFA